MEDQGHENAPGNGRAIADAAPGTLEAAIADLERRTLNIKADIDRAARVADQLTPLRSRLTTLQQRTATLEPVTLQGRLVQLQDEASLLYIRIRPPGAPAVPEPRIEDLRRQLPSGTGKPYPIRLGRPVRRIVIHHTVTSPSITPVQLAQAHIRQGKPGLPYHYLVAADGKIYWTQALETVAGHTGLAQVNNEAVGVALVGNFTTLPPPPAQLAAAAGLVAWLLSRFGLEPDAVVGRRELEQVGSPGIQWDGGVRYKDALLARVRALLWATREPDSIIAGLRQEMATIQSRLEAGECLAAQVSELRDHVAELELALAGSSPAPERSPAARVGAPPWKDVVKTLPHHPTLPPYPQRPQPPTTVVIHHTDSPTTTTVEAIARYHVFGEKRDQQGNELKVPWPGIGYHYVIAADGTIYKCNEDMTRSYHVGGAANGTCIGVSLIGRFMRLGYDGKEQPIANQSPTPQQLKSAGRLVAWLTQQYGMPDANIKGHKDVAGTSCPGEYWRDGPTWKNLLLKEVRLARDPQTTPKVEHYLLFWDHGVQWAEHDWVNAQSYISRFRPTCGFLLTDALLAQRVTIVGATGGVSAAAEAQLRAAGVIVHRLDGRNVAETKALLDALVAKGTPWPGAPPRSLAAAEAAIVERELDEPGRILVPDVWTVPDDWEAAR